MRYFEKPRRFNGYVKKFIGKKERLKQGKESVRKKACIVTVYAPVSKSIMEHLPQKAKAFFAKSEDNDQEDIIAHKMEVDWQMICMVKFFGASTYNKLAKPQLEKGGTNEEQVRFKVKKFFLVEEIPMMEIELRMWHDEKTWAWGGQVYGDEELTIEVKPLQPELPLEGEGDDGGEDDEGEDGK